MVESIHKYFQMGTIQWMSFPRKNVLDAIQRIASDDFFDAIEISHFANDDERRRAKEMLEQAHMRVCFGAQPMLLGSGLNPNDLDEDGRLRAEQVLISAVDEAEYLGARGIAFLAGKWTEEHKAEHYAQLLKTTRAVCAHAAKKGMIVEMEVFDYDMDKAALIGPAPLAARFAADVRSYCSNFGLMVDLSHFPTTYETSKFVIQTLRPYITHFHIGNAVVHPGCEAYGDLHPRPIGQGNQLLQLFLAVDGDPSLIRVLPILVRLTEKSSSGPQGSVRQKLQRPDFKIRASLARAVAARQKILQQIGRASCRERV